MSEVKVANAEVLNVLKLNLKEATNKLTFHENISSFELLTKAKFGKYGFDPEIPVRKLNFIEQVNQTFTAMVTYRAVEWLWDNGYKNQKFTLNLGPKGGTDIESESEEVAAEAFATVDPANNEKLTKDKAKVGKTTKKAKFIFYTSPKLPNEKYKEQKDGTRTFGNKAKVKKVYFPLEDVLEFYEK